MREPPLISIIVASYNYENFIKKTLSSLISQTYNNYEIIVVDDGSQDNSLEVIKEYQKKHPQIKLFQHENSKNKGLPKSIELALNNCQGEWIAFCESDDYWDNNYLQEKVNYISNHPDVDLVVNDIHKFSKDESLGDLSLDDIRFKKLDKYILPHNMFSDLYSKNIIPTFSCVMIKKNILDNCDFNSSVPAWLDWWLWRQISFSKVIGYLPQKLTFWRIHRDSYLNKSNNNKTKLTKEFIKKNNRVIRCKYVQGSIYKQITFTIKVIVEYIIRKFFKVKIKDGYIRVSFIGLRILKIKSW